MVDLVVPPPVPATDMPYVLCVGAPFEDCAAISRVVANGTVVLVAPDTESARALLLGSGPSAPPGPRHQVVECGPLRIDLAARVATWSGRPIDLTAREFDLLVALATDVGRAWSFEELTAQVWRTRYLGDTEAVASAVKRLRRRLLDVAHDLRIASVRGVGYRLVLPD